jgi:predicted peroxiredoxin
MPRPLVVKVTCGADDPERCNQGLTVAATALTSGSEVSLWLAGEGAWLGAAGREPFQLPHAASPVGLVETVLAAGRVTVCTQCAARRGITETDLLPGVRIAGAAAFAEEVLGPDVQALVY